MIRNLNQLAFQGFGTILPERRDDPIHEDRVGERRQLRLVPLSENAVPAEKSLQFWTKADDWSAPVSLGLVNPGEAIEVPVDRLPPLQPNQLFELTLEPAGGSPIGRPTGPIQFIGRAVQL